MMNLLLEILYEKEIQKVDINSTGVFKIDKILKTRIVKGNKEYFVKWLNYPATYNQWIKEKDFL